MKTSYSRICRWAAPALMVAVMASCSDDFLKPDPMSEFEPGATFGTESGIQAAMAMADRHLGRMFIDLGNTNSMGMLSDLLYSETTVAAKTDMGSANIRANFADNVTPSSWMETGNNSGAEIGWVWNDMWDHVKYANTILDYVDGVETLSQDVKNEYKGRALFHRSWAFYNLTFWYGNIPLVTTLPTGPKKNYISCPQSEVVKKIVEDLKQAVEWVPSQNEMNQWGSINKEACRHLYIKALLADGQFREAENQATILIEQSGRSLMRSTFGKDIKPGEAKTWKIERNVIWDLHRPENKILAANTEYILGFVNVSEQAFQKLVWARTLLPHYRGNILTADGTPGNGLLYLARSDSKYNVETDWLRATGRGIGVTRPTDWAQRTLWVYPGFDDNKEDHQDLRHNPAVGNWMRMEDMTYDNPATKYYKQNLMLYAPEDVVSKSGKLIREKGQLLCTDTIRSWFDFPYYKVYMLDAEKEASLGSNDFQGATLGSNGNCYIFRLAETYLLRAEARLYQGNAGGAAADVNEVRKRANAKYMYPTVNIGDIMNERARELYMEEFRKAELGRVSMILANTGIPDEWGNVYDKETWNKQNGTDRTGGSYWYQRLMHYSFYNSPDVPFKSGGIEITYKMDKHNLYWPIPHFAETANSEAKLWQNFGYDGYDPNCKMWATWQEADEDAHK